jgi:hypothetical protein
MMSTLAVILDHRPKLEQILSSASCSHGPPRGI